MFSIRSVLCAALTLGALLATSPAEARFGKRSSSDNSSSSSDDDHKKEKKHRDNDNNTHEASAIGTERSHQTGGGSSSSNDDCCYEPSPRSHVVVESDFSFWAFLFSAGTHSVPLDAAYVPGPDGQVHERRHSAPLSLRMGLQGGPMGDGAAGDAFIGLDGERLGIVAQVTGLGLPTDDGTEGTDNITLLEAHLTYALISLERVRLRAEAGVSTASAPDISFVGPSLGMSLEACVVGPLDIEARAQATPLPYRQLDGSAGLALHLGALVVRGGVRGLLLDDAGEVDGVQHVDTFAGPYVGLGLTF